jgi:hypothetical protein
MSGGVTFVPITLPLLPSPSVADSGVPGVTVSDAPAAVVPPGEADAGIEDDCVPRRSGMVTSRRVEGTNLGNLATFTVRARRTDPE